MDNWPFILLEAAVGLSLLVMSRQQPFPGPARRMGWLMIGVFALFVLAETAPREVAVLSHLVLLIILGGIGTLKGIHNMMITRREVLVAPFSGALFCAGSIGLMAEDWPNLSTFEHFAAFLTAVLLIGGQVWLVFRGLLIGRLPLAWSQAGIQALQRGLIEGEHGAIWCFERAWDLEEEHLNPMAWIALEKINRHLGNDSKADEWQTRAAESGGVEAVASEWIEAIEQALKSLLPEN
ncbi:MAG: hypothetical protein ACKVJ7_01540 [Candidatus Poseidoniales archaeon]